MYKRRVLIVDDSVVIRRSLTDALSRDPQLEVVGSAPTGRVAMMKISLVCPDIVVLDVEMPEMSGLDTLAAIRHAHPQLPVIMLGVSTAQGAAATLDALTLGARDYVTKPDTNSNDGLRVLSNELISKMQEWFPDASLKELVRSSRQPVPTA